jgi:hypothetical protein
LLSLLIDKDLWSKRNRPDSPATSVPRTSSSTDGQGVVSTPAQHQHQQQHLQQGFVPSAANVSIITVGQSPPKGESSSSSSGGGGSIGGGGSEGRANQGTQTGPLSPGEVKAASPGSSDLQPRPVTAWVPPVYANEAEQDAAELERYVPEEKLALLKTIQT